MISQTAEYALRSVVCLASQPDTPLTTSQIAGITKVPANYLSKVLQALGRAGVVSSQRGLHGGFVLTQPPDSLTLLEVINSVDPIKRIDHCPLDLKQHGTTLCPLHRRLNESIGMIEKVFRTTTVGALLKEGGASRPLCETSENVRSG